MKIKTRRPRMKSMYQEIDTPALLIDQEIMIKNIKDMQKKAESLGLNLRPHTKTHKMPELAKLQIQEGARGIAVAKVGEAEVMASEGIKDIFIANEIVGESKIKRIRKLKEKTNIFLGVDNPYQAKQLEKVFKEQNMIIDVLIEIEVGEARSGIVSEEKFIELVKLIKNSNHVNLKGIFSHDGHSYGANSIDEIKEIFIQSQKDTLRYKKIAEELNSPVEVVSIGSTPSFMFDFEILDGITEIRIGTYIFMDVIQSNIIDDYSKCAASVLTSVISKPTKERVVTDAGAKALTMQGRNSGLGKTQGIGLVKGFEKFYIEKVYDEHGVINNKDFNSSVCIGDKIEIIPNHICPVVNLYDKGYLVSKGKILKEITVSARGKIQ
jgi:D-serine deaminase-like pyridoxal phosphate-dependent protein